MFTKLRLEGKIKQCKKEIVEIEKKRYRSQANLVEAILTSKAPDDKDVEYFNQYTKSIEDLREQIRKYQEEIEKL